MIELVLDELYVYGGSQTQSKNRDTKIHAVWFVEYSRLLNVNLILYSNQVGFSFCDYQKLRHFI
jgi:hypothetical protein